MPPIKKWLTVLLVTNIALVVTCVLAQQQPSNIWRDLRKDPNTNVPKVTEDGGILCGSVVAFGEFLPRPYYVTFRDDTVWINSIAYYPMRPNPNPPPVEPEVQYSDTAEAVFALWVELHSRVPELFKQYGEQKAREMVMQEYQNNPLIKSLVYDDSTKIFWGEFPVEGRFYVPSVRSFMCDRPTPTPQEVTDERQYVEKSVRQLLLDSGIILFGHNFEVRTKGADAYKIIDAVVEVKRDSVSVEEGRKKIRKVIHDDKMVQDIIEHLDSWPDDIK